MKVFSLYSGGGLGDYGLTLAGMEIVGQCEIDEYCQKILSLRWPNVPKWRDIRNANGKEIRERCGDVDMLSGGFPCQDISSAGQGRGIVAESRSGLWKEYFRLICEIRPKFVFVENVAMLLSRGLGIVLGDLASIGYDAEWECFSSAIFGSPHRRDRVWIVAYPRGYGVRGEQSIFKKSRDLGECLQLDRASHWNKVQIERTGAETILQNYSHPYVCRVDDGPTGWMDRLKCCGNGQVVQCVQWIGERIMEYEKSKRISKTISSKK
jgi:DNA (cytosine-5)-methyltransferase 1